ncbi:hypothetical protein WQE_39894 [Paraburkholderia hospita]|uniref:Uncharacterized protein n=1 Tax=Paraburkholderia hospita TaxID=169430 RepID=A0ABP2PBV7_9BURK|nr:hypothetical protein [Paraburkholderia hospita]EIM95294.1 hypothetical protein WQE_39894 [Paraburkholderia hospita]
MVKPAPTVVAGAGQPLASDEDDHRVDRLHGALQSVREIFSTLDATLDVHEHVVGAEVLAQAIEEPPRVGLTVDAPVADEDRGHVGPSLVLLCVARAAAPWRLGRERAGAADAARLHIEHTVRMDSSSALATWSVVCANFQSGFELRAL